MSLRQYNTELGSLVDKIVKVYLDKDKFFVGQLKGVSENSNLILTNAKNEKNKPFPKLFIRNSFYNFVSLEEEPFPMKALADRIATIFTKGHVNYIEDQNIISILNGKIIVDENEVRGSGPSADRVKKIFDQFMMDLENPIEE
ncbi:MAG: Lsm family RNA-binding protein [Candidatus Lokiarchaeota archaeon]|nr:Lsm family RNA-binding protein [Candidatus Lokiarchaeota archaeon]